ncbi:TadE/TadG family type IV pilus assembly protein [Streptomyces sp. NPDC056010]|uniref:TadE/TadG family type IV pilus assembly protein n=1 Tax=Streptomyces sp. NPDC056010 TaxID=3345679 RepID=UPI0035E2107D
MNNAHMARQPALLKEGRRAALRRRHNDHGFGSVEFAVLAVVVLALAFTALQVGLYYHARKVAQSAARQGVEAGRQFGAGEGDGVAQAQDFLHRFGGSVRGASVSSAGSNAREIRITVRGSVATLVPGLTLDVVQHADGPVERWSAP